MTREVLLDDFSVAELLVTEMNLSYSEECRKYLSSKEGSTVLFVLLGVL
jgi:hypothetical protein